MRCVLGPVKAVPADTPPSPSAAAAASGTATATAGILAFSALCSCSPLFSLPTFAPFFLSSLFFLLACSFLFSSCVGHDVTQRLRVSRFFSFLLASLSWRDSKNRVFNFVPGRSLLCEFFYFPSFCVLTSGIYLGQREAVKHFPLFFFFARFCTVHLV